MTDYLLVTSHKSNRIDKKKQLKKKREKDIKKSFIMMRWNKRNGRNVSICGF